MKSAAEQRSRERNRTNSSVKWQCLEKSKTAEIAGAEVNGRLFGTNAEFKRWMKNLYSHCPRYLRAVVYFVSRYFFMFGFLDGYAGWYWHTRQGLM